MRQRGHNGEPSGRSSEYGCGCPVRVLLLHVSQAVGGEPLDLFAAGISDWDQPFLNYNLQIATLVIRVNAPPQALLCYL